jgi:hypothetical protein
MSLTTIENKKLSYPWGVFWRLLLVVQYTGSFLLFTYLENSEITENLCAEHKMNLSSFSTAFAGNICGFETHVDFYVKYQLF